MNRPRPSWWLVFFLPALLLLLYKLLRSASPLLLSVAALVLVSVAIIKYAPHCGCRFREGE